MQATPRVQLVVSGKFITLFLLSLSLLGGGYYWYSLQQQARQQVWQTQERFKTPPYFVNRGASVIRGCGHCVDLGKLKPQPEWKVGPPKEIPAEERRWFLAVEDPPLPVTVAGVLMLPVHPAFQDDPSFGFDQTRVMLVLYQSLERRTWIESPPPPSPASLLSQPPQPDTTLVEPERPADEAEADRPDDSSPSSVKTVPWQSAYVGDWRNIDFSTASLTRLLITSDEDKLLVHPWAKCLPVDCDWGMTAIESLPAAKHFLLVWDHKYAYEHLDLFLQDDGRLRVSLQTRFTNKADHVDTEIVSYFMRPAVTP